MTTRPLDEHHRSTQGPVIVGVSSHAPDLRRTLEIAAGAANRKHVGLTLVHGCSTTSLLSTLNPTGTLRNQQVSWRKRLDLLAETAAELLDPEQTVGLLVHRGTGVQALVEASATASLVVLQRRPRSPGHRIRVGSTSALVATGAHAPVAVLQTSAASSAMSGDVVVGVGVDDPSPALTVAFAEAELRRTGLLVVHAWQPRRTSLFIDGPTEEVEFRRQLRAAHQDLVDRVRCWASRYPDVPLRHRLYTLPPAETVLRAASEAQLLVLGRRRPGHRGAAGLGHVARRCLADSPCPVLLTADAPRVHAPAAVLSR